MRAVLLAIATAAALGFLRSINPIAHLADPSLTRLAAAAVGARC